MMNLEAVLNRAASTEVTGSSQWWTIYVDPDGYTVHAETAQTHPTSHEAHAGAQALLAEILDAGYIVSGGTCTLGTVAIFAEVGDSEPVQWRGSVNVRVRPVR